MGNLNNQGFSDPVGSIKAMIGDVLPSGFLELDGATGLSRTTYINLWTYAQAQTNYTTQATKDGGGDTYLGYFGDGDGSTTFSIPLIEDFLRGMSATRAVGSFTADENKAHGHTASSSNDGVHSHNLLIMDSYAASAYMNDNSKAGAGAGAVASNWRASRIANSASHNHPVTVNNSAGEETRPRNIAVLYCIKY